MDMQNIVYGVIVQTLLVKCQHLIWFQYFQFDELVS